jgi:hypothetical protein
VPGSFKQATVAAEQYFGGYPQGRWPMGDHHRGDTQAKNLIEYLLLYGFTQRINDGIVYLSLEILRIFTEAAR